MLFRRIVVTEMTGIFYNPVTIALGKNDFKRKWGRRKLEDNWRRQNKSMVEFNSLNEDLAAEGEQKKRIWMRRAGNIT